MIRIKNDLEKLWNGLTGDGFNTNDELKQMEEGKKQAIAAALGEWDKMKTEDMSQDILSNFNADTREVTDAKIQAMRDAKLDTTQIEKQVAVLRQQDAAYKASKSLTPNQANDFGVMNSDFNILTNVGIGVGMKIDAERNLIKLEGEILRELYEYGDGGAYSIKATTETTLERNGEVLPYDQFKNPLLKKYLNSVNNNTISWKTANNKDNDINWTSGDNILVGAMTLGASWGYASTTATGTVIKTGLKSVALDATFGAGVNMMTYGVTTGLSGNDFKLKDFAISGIAGGVTGAALSPFTGKSAYGFMLTSSTRLTIPAATGFSTDLLSQYVSSGYDYSKLNLVQAGWTGFNYGLASFVGGITKGSSVTKSLTGNSFRLVPSVVGGGALGSLDELQLGNIYKSINERSDRKIKKGEIKLD